MGRRARGEKKRKERNIGWKNKMGGKKRIFCICLCCGKVIKHTTESSRFVQCLECQRKGNSELLELSEFRRTFDDMMVQEAKIGLFSVRNGGDKDGRRRGRVVELKERKRKRKGDDAHV